MAEKTREVKKLRIYPPLSDNKLWPSTLGDAHPGRLCNENISFSIGGGRCQILFIEEEDGDAWQWWWSWCWRWRRIYYLRAALESRREEIYRSIDCGCWRRWLRHCPFFLVWWLLFLSLSFLLSLRNRCCQVALRRDLVFGVDDDDLLFLDSFSEFLRPIGECLRRIILGPMAAA